MAKAKRPPPRRSAADDGDNGDAASRGMMMSPAMMQAMQAMMASRAPTMKTGGTVPKTGLYKMHKGERVIPNRSRRAGPDGGNKRR
jgi:hypothetical protein